MIEDSLYQQYHLTPERLDSMTWPEFAGLLSGIGPDTPLGRVVQIRSETDKDALASYTPGMNRIRSEWLAKQARMEVHGQTQKEINDNLEALKAFFQGAG